MLSSMNYPQFQIDLQGRGILYRDKGKFPPKSRALLSKVGNEIITSIELIRTPLRRQSVINLITNNKLANTLKELNIDQVFHLAMIIGTEKGKYLLDKQEVLNFEHAPKIQEKDAETLMVPVKGNISIETLVEKTKKQMGDEKFSSYDAKTNNCSVFIKNVLSSNGLSNSQSDKFVTQKANEILDKFPYFARILLKATTQAAAIANRVIEGEGKR